jgi:acetylornithine deacetylase/succinyl-diaminopimelate desuccinylase-like protein
MTVTLISGRNVNEVKVTCDVRLLPGFDESYLKKILNELSQKWDCEYTILSLGKGYESSPEGEFMSILEQATLEALGKTKEEAEILPFVSMGSSDGRYLVDSGAHVYGYSPVYSWDMTFDTAVSMVHGVNEKIHKDSVLLGCRALTLAVRKAAEKEELQ